MEFRLKKYLKQTGVAMTEYAVLLAFVAAVGASFTSDSGLSSSISGAVSKVVSVFGYFGGYKEVADGNQPNIAGKGRSALGGLAVASLLLVDGAGIRFTLMTQDKRLALLF